MIAVKHGRRKGFRLIRNRLTYSRKVHWETSHHEAGHCRDIVWTPRAMPTPDWVIEQWPGSATIIAVRSQADRDGRRVDETRYYVTSLRTSAKALLRQVRNRWSIENSWHWVRDVTLREDAHLYRETNGVQIVAMLRTMAINSLRLNGIWSVTEGIAAFAHDIKGLLMLLGRREPATALPSG